MKVKRTHALLVAAIVGVAFAGTAFGVNYEGKISDKVGTNFIWNADLWSVPGTPGTFPNGPGDNAKMTWDVNADLDLAGGAFQVGTFEIVRNDGDPDIVNGSLMLNTLVRSGGNRDTDLDVSLMDDGNVFVIRNEMTGNKLRLNNVNNFNNGLVFTGNGTAQVDVDTDGGASFAGPLTLDYDGQMYWDDMKAETMNWTSMDVFRNGQTYFDDSGGGPNNWNVAGNLTIHPNATLQMSAENTSGNNLNVVGGLNMAAGTTLQFDNNNGVFNATVGGPLSYASNTIAFNLNSSLLTLNAPGAGNGTINLNSGRINAAGIDVLGNGTVNVAGQLAVADGALTPTQVVNVNKGGLVNLAPQTVPEGQIVVNADGAIAGTLLGYTLQGTPPVGPGQIQFNPGAVTNVPDVALGFAADNSLQLLVDIDGLVYTINTAALGNKKGTFALVGGVTPPLTTATLANLDPANDANIRVIGDVTLAGLTISSGTGRASYTFDSKITLSAPSLGVPVHNLNGLVSQQNSDLIALDGPGVIAPGQTYNVTNGRVRIGPNGTGAVNAGTLNINAGATMYLESGDDDDASAGVVANINNGGALYLDGAVDSDSEIPTAIIFAGRSILALDRDYNFGGPSNLQGLASAAPVIAIQGGGDDFGDVFAAGLVPGATIQSDADGGGKIKNHGGILALGDLNVLPGSGGRFEIEDDVTINGNLIGGSASAVDYLQGSNDVTRVNQVGTGEVRYENAVNVAGNVIIDSGKHTFWNATIGGNVTVNGGTFNWDNAGVLVIGPGRSLALTAPGARVDVDDSGTGQIVVQGAYADVPGSQIKASTVSSAGGLYWANGVVNTVNADFITALQRNGWTVGADGPGTVVNYAGGGVVAGGGSSNNQAFTFNITNSAVWNMTGAAAWPIVPSSNGSAVTLLGDGTGIVEFQPGFNGQFLGVGDTDGIGPGGGGNPAADLIVNNTTLRTHASINLPNAAVGSSFVPQDWNQIVLVNNGAWQVRSNNQAMNNGITMLGTTAIDVAPGLTLTQTGLADLSQGLAIGGTGTITGGGTLTLNGVLDSLAASSVLNVQAGTTVDVNHTPQVNTIGSFTVASGSQLNIGPGATLQLASTIATLSSAASADLAINGTLDVDVSGVMLGGTTDIAVRGLVNGGIIISSTAAIQPNTAVGYVAVGPDVKVQYATKGDANLDQLIDASDIGILLTNFGSVNAVWGDADFNQDLLVDASDVGDILSNFTGDPGPAPVGSVVAEYDPATGEIIVSVDGVLNWLIEATDGSAVMTGDPAANLPSGGGLVTDNDFRVGESNFGGTMTYTDVNLGNVAVTGLVQGELIAKWQTGFGAPTEQIEVVVIPEPASLMLLGLGGMLMLRRRRAA